MRFLTAAVVGGVTAATITLVFMVFLKREPPTILVAVLAVGAGMTAARQYPAKASPASAEEAPRSRQLVGQTCPVCDRRIAVAADAAACDGCGAAVHNDCAAEHACGS